MKRTAAAPEGQLQPPAKKKVVAPRRGGKQAPADEIWFYNQRGPYGFLSNFYKSKVVVDGVTYRTAEHYFQSQKFSGTDAASRETARVIREAKTPMEAKKLAGQPQKLGVQGKKLEGYGAIGWFSGLRDQVLKRALEAKFAPGSQLAGKLLETGTKRLVEHTTNDDYWGDGGGGGVNRLGQLLMEVREQLRRQQEPQQAQQAGQNQQAPQQAQQEVQQAQQAGQDQQAPHQAQQEPQHAQQVQQEEQEAGQGRADWPKGRPSVEANVSVLFVYSGEG